MFMADFNDVLYLVIILTGLWTPGWNLTWLEYLIQCIKYYIQNLDGFVNLMCMLLWVCLEYSPWILGGWGKDGLPGMKQLQIIWTAQIPLLITKTKPPNHTTHPKAAIWLYFCECRSHSVRTILTILFKVKYFLIHRTVWCHHRPVLEWRCSCWTRSWL